MFFDMRSHAHMQYQVEEAVRNPEAAAPNKAAPTSNAEHTRPNILLPISIFVMLIWPRVFIGISR